MLFFVVSDQGIETTPISAVTLSDAADQIRQRFGNGLNHDNQTPVNVALLIPQQVGTVTPDGSGNPANATLTATGDGATLATLRQQGQTALSNNATYLAIPSPTNAQVVAQVRALTQQADGLIRMAIANLSATT